MKPVQFCLKLLILHFIFVHSVCAQNTSIFISKGDSAFSKGKFDLAIEFYTMAIKENTKLSQAYAYRGFSYIWNTKIEETKRLNLAIKDCSMAIEMQPDSADFYYYRSEAYAQKDWLDSAIADINMFVKLGEKQVKNKNELTTFYEKRIDLYKKAELYYPAIEDYNRLIQIDSANVEYYRGRFIAYYSTNQMDLALEDATRMLEMRPTYYGYYNNRGLCYNSLGEYQLAVNDFLTNLNHRLDGGNPYINIISPLVRLNRFNEAIFFYRLYQNNKALYENLPKPKALPCFLDEPAFKFYRYFIKAVTQVNNSMPEDALRSLDSASLFYNSRINDTTNKTRRGYMDVLYLRGYLLKKQGKFAEAKANFEQAMVLDSRQPDVKKALEELQYERAAAKTRGDDDRTLPVIKGIQVDTIKTIAQLASADSIVIKISGNASDEAGIKAIKINQYYSLFSKEDEEVRFFYRLRKKRSDSTDIVVTVIDSSNLENNYYITNRQTRGGEVTVTGEETEKTTGSYHAILIAEKDYADHPRIKNLNFPIEDANRLRNVLLNKYTFLPENIDTLYNRSREDILEAIIAIGKKLKENDNLLIFYAGHGDTTHDRFKNIEGYLKPSSAKQGLISYYISSDDIKKALLRSNAKHILLLLDACYSGTFTRGNDSTEVTGDIWKQWEWTSRKVMTSGNVELVPDKSFFINYLLKFLEENKKPYLSTKDVWEYVDKGIRDHEKEKQKENGRVEYYSPQYSAITGVGDMGGTFIFRRKPEKKSTD